MEQKLIVSASPHLRSGATTQKIMLDVIIALAPAAVASVILFGPRALLLMAVSVASCVLCEYICRRVLKRPQTVNDLSAVVTGLLLAFNLPPEINPLVAVFGAVVAIVVVKQMFGGIGQNFVNPALTARIILMTSFPTRMTTWTAPFAYMNGEADAMTTATPLALSAQGATDSLPGLLEMFLGVRGGCLGLLWDHQPADFLPAGCLPRYRYRRAGLRGSAAADENHHPGGCPAASQRGKNCENTCKKVTFRVI